MQDSIYHITHKSNFICIFVHQKRHDFSIRKRDFIDVNT